VKPFVKSNKNDFLDAEAIAEAVDRKNMRFVPIRAEPNIDTGGEITLLGIGARRSVSSGSLRRAFHLSKMRSAPC
jgi:hypothetical protein